MMSAAVGAVAYRYGPVSAAGASRGGSTQTALLEIKRNGTGSLARIDQFGWSTAMALVDVLLHLVWIKR